MKKRSFIALFLLIILSTYNFTLNPNFIPKLNIKKIKVKNNEIINDDEIKKNYLFYMKQIFYSQIQIQQKKKLKKQISQKALKLKKFTQMRYRLRSEKKNQQQLFKIKKKRNTLQAKET